jgi:hypothetical protein
LKQHTGFGTGDLHDSQLSLQGSHLKTSPVRNFYLSLGFLAYDANDNGLSLTSDEFKEKVTQYPKVWIPPERDKMTLFRLLHGRIKLLTVLDLTGASDSELMPTWKSYTYCKFPYPCDSMKKIESFVDDLPILKWLSISALPLTHRPLSWMRSASVMSGLIVGDRRVQMTWTSWLSTDEMQFLCAFLM